MGETLRTLRLYDSTILLSYPNPAPLSHSGRMTRTSKLSTLSVPETALVRRTGTYPVSFGGYSDIWKGEMVKDGVVIPVAIKVLRPVGMEPDSLHKRLEHEIRCWEPLDHQNVAPFYGVVSQSNGAPGFVLPWYINGSVNIYLLENPYADPIEIIKEVAAGIEYLHDMGLVHGDLKGPNIMIDDDGHVKLIDFGLSRLINTDDGFTTSATSSIRWCAPELLRLDALPTKASDVYAFASTALELLTGHVPYNAVKERVVPFTVMKGVKPREMSRAFRYDVPRCTELWDLLESCWAESNLRPSIHDVRLRLRELY